MTNEASTLLISDLHLEASRPQITAALLDFLAHRAVGCPRLFILGDLFEAWLGDDDPSPPAPQVAAALAALAKGGTEVFIMHGNRDFLLGQDYCRRCGASLIDEPYSLPTAAGPVLLMHGDTLCTDDHDYQQFRQMVRAEQWQKDFLARPLAERQAFAKQARAESKAATANKPNEIMDVNQSAVIQALESTNHTRMLHGHTHRPAIHDLHLSNGTPAQRTVLGDWSAKLWYAEVTADGAIHLHEQPISS